MNMMTNRNKELQTTRVCRANRRRTRKGSTEKGYEDDDDDDDDNNFANHLGGASAGTKCDRDEVAVRAKNESTFWTMLMSSKLNQGLEVNVMEENAVNRVNLVDVVDVVEHKHNPLEQRHLQHQLASRGS